MYGTRSSVQGTAVVAGRMFYMCTMFSNGSSSLGYTTLTIAEANVRGKARRSGEGSPSGVTRPDVGPPARLYM